MALVLVSSLSLRADTLPCRLLRRETLTDGGGLSDALRLHTLDAVGCMYAGPSTCMFGVLRASLTTMETRRTVLRAACCVLVSSSSPADNRGVASSWRGISLMAGVVEIDDARRRPATLRSRWQRRMA